MVRPILANPIHLCCVVVGVADGVSVCVVVCCCVLMLFVVSCGCLSFVVVVRGVFVVVVRVVFVVVCCCGSCWWCVVVGLDHLAPAGGLPSTGPPPPDLQNFRAFFPSPATNFALFLSLTVCLLVEFWWFL